MTAIKDIKVTEEFLGLGQTITKCQIEESRADCETRKYREIALATCQCAPLSVRSYYGEQVQLSSLAIFIDFDCIDFLQSKICSSTELDCINNVVVPEGECLEQCDGSIVEVQRLSTVKNEDGLATFLSHYEKYKNPEKTNLTFPNRMKGVALYVKSRFLFLVLRSSVYK